MATVPARLKAASRRSATSIGHHQLGQGNHLVPMVSDGVRNNGRFETGDSPVCASRLSPHQILTVFGHPPMVSLLTLYQYLAGRHSPSHPTCTYRYQSRRAIPAAFDAGNDFSTNTIRCSDPPARHRQSLHRRRPDRPGIYSRRTHHCRHRPPHQERHLQLHFYSVDHSPGRGNGTRLSLSLTPDPKR